MSQCRVACARGDCALGCLKQQPTCRAVCSVTRSTWPFRSWTPTRCPVAAAKCGAAMGSVIRILKA